MNCPSFNQTISVNMVLARLLVIGPRFTAGQAARLLNWPVDQMARTLHRFCSQGLVTIAHHGEGVTTPYALTQRGKRRGELLNPAKQPEPPSTRKRVLQALSPNAATADTTLARQLRISIDELDQHLDALIKSGHVRRSVNPTRFMYRRAV